MLQLDPIVDITGWENTLVPNIAEDPGSRFPVQARLQLQMYYLSDAGRARPGKGIDFCII